MTTGQWVLFSNISFWSIEEINKNHGILNNKYDYPEGKQENQIHLQQHGQV